MAKAKSKQESDTQEKILIPYGYSPRPYQLPILTALDRGCKRAVWCCHRRGGGKDLTVLELAYQGFGG